MAESGAGCSSRGLAGRGIVVTRPRDQASGLTELVKACGGRPIAFPSLEIVAAPASAALQDLVDRLDAFDLAIFVSPTAARLGIELIRCRRQLPAGLRVAAIGKGSARELERLGVKHVIVPDEGADSEALLALPQLQAMRGRAVLVFRGAGGRELLKAILEQRGARVEYAECYRRARPQGDAQALRCAFNRGEIHAVTVTSTEGLKNLFGMVGTAARHWLCKTPLFVAHERIASRAREFGVETVVVSGTGDAAMVGAMIRYFGGEPVE